MRTIVYLKSTKLFKVFKCLYIIYLDIIFYFLTFHSGCHSSLNKKKFPDFSSFSGMQN